MTLFRRVGKVAKPHGLTGEIKLHIGSGDLSWAKKLKTCLLSKKDPLEIDSSDLQGAQLYEVEKIRGHDDDPIVKLKNINDRNASDLLQKMFFYIPMELLTSKPGEALFLRELENFAVWDFSNQQKIGQITGFASNGPQDILVVDSADAGEVLVPLIQEFINKIEFDKKIIWMTLPPGLLDINRQ